MTEQGWNVLAALLALALSALLTPWAIRLAPVLGAVDVPLDGRRMHRLPTPRTGGLAMFVAFLLTVGMVGMAQGALIRLLLGAMLLVLLGAVDDIFRLPALLKLMVQLLAGALAISGTAALSYLSLGKVVLATGKPGVLLSVLWVVAMINAHNMIDGVDGLAASVSAVEALILAVLLMWQGNVSLGGVALVLCGTCLGYLPYNVHPARVFMGDVGSQLLGFLLGYLSLHLDQRAAGALGALLPLLVLAVPLSDLSFAVVRRGLRGQSPFAADRGHWHHRLADAGFSQRQICFWMTLICALLGIVALLISRSNWYGYAVYAVLWTVVALMCMRLLYGTRRRT